MKEFSLLPQEGLLRCIEDGRELGYIVFLHRADGCLEVISTYVDSTCRGQGIAEMMTRELLEWVQAEGLMVAPLCSYTAAFMQRTPEYRRYLVVSEEVED